MEDDPHHRDAVQRFSEAMNLMGAVVVDKVFAEMVAQRGKPALEHALRDSIESVASFLRLPWYSPPSPPMPGESEWGPWPDMNEAKRTIPPRLEAIRAALDEEGLGDRVRLIAAEVLEAIIGPRRLAGLKARGAGAGRAP